MYLSDSAAINQVVLILQPLHKDVKMTQMWLLEDEQSVLHVQLPNIHLHSITH